MNANDRLLLENHLDGRLDTLDEARVTLLLERDEAARRFVREHRAVWDALGEAFGEGEQDEASDEFAQATVARALRDRPRRRLPLSLAAALLLSLGFAVWWQSSQLPPGELDPADQEVVRHLHVLRDLELLDEHAEALDLRLRWDMLQAFQGEQEDEG